MHHGFVWGDVFACVRMRTKLLFHGSDKSYTDTRTTRACVVLSMLGAYNIAHNAHRMVTKLTALRIEHDQAKDGTRIFFGVSIENGGGH